MKKFLLGVGALLTLAFMSTLAMWLALPNIR